MNDGLYRSERCGESDRVWRLGVTCVTKEPVDVVGGGGRDERGCAGMSARVSAESGLSVLSNTAIAGGFATERVKGSDGTVV